jgi:hypothetical protein
VSGQHTPGPWHATDQIERTYEGNIVRAGDPERGTIVAIACDFNRFDGDDERVANARLISAAPDLLDSCEALLRFNEELCEDVSVSTHYPGAERARAAIAKATGR